MFFYKFTDYTRFLYLSRYWYLRSGHHFSPWEEGEGGGVGWYEVRGFGGFQINLCDSTERLTLFSFLLIPPSLSIRLFSPARSPILLCSRRLTFVSTLALISQIDNLDSATVQLSSILATTQSNLDSLNDTQINSILEVPVKVKVYRRFYRSSFTSNLEPFIRM